MPSYPSTPNPTPFDQPSALPIVRPTSDASDCLPVSCFLGCGCGDNSDPGIYPLNDGLPRNSTGDKSILPLAGLGTTTAASKIVAQTCLADEVPIQLLDGRMKLASEVVAGDVLIGFNPEGNRHPETVAAIRTSLARCVEVVHGLGCFIASTSHVLPLMGNDPCGRAGALNPGKHQLRGEDGSPVEILDVRDAGLHQVYGWECTPDHVFLAGGILHHNILNK